MMEWLQRGIIDLTRATVLSPMVRARRMIGDLAPETEDDPETGDRDPGAAVVERGLALETREEAEITEVATGKAGAGAETREGRGAGREWRGSARERGGSESTGGGKRGSRGRGKTGDGGSVRGKGKKKRYAVLALV